MKGLGLRAWRVAGESRSENMMRETIRLSAAVEEGERLADVATYLLADELCDGPDGGANVSDELPAPHDGPPPAGPAGGSGVQQDGSGTQVRRSTRPTA